MAEDIRWKQRFENFEKALALYESAAKQKKLSVLEQAGLIQLFELTFELAWKTLKDYLEEQGVAAKFPRETIKEGFKYDFIKDGDIWMDMLSKRNLIAHTYDEYNAIWSVRLIKDTYLAELKQLASLFRLKL